VYLTGQQRDRRAGLGARAGPRGRVPDGRTAGAVTMSLVRALPAIA